jgi:hypothetical protein
LIIFQTSSFVAFELIAKANIPPADDPITLLTLIFKFFNYYAASITPTYANPLAPPP